eukprot:395014-Amphidinium_carterae.2
MKKGGLTEQEIDKAYEHFNERAPNLFNSPNVRNLPGLPQLCEKYTVKNLTTSRMKMTRKRTKMTDTTQDLENVKAVDSQQELREHQKAT